MIFSNGGDTPNNKNGTSPPVSTASEELQQKDTNSSTGGANTYPSSHEETERTESPRDQQPEVEATPSVTAETPPEETKETKRHASEDEEESKRKRRKDDTPTPRGTFVISVFIQFKIGVVFISLKMVFKINDQKLVLKTEIKLYDKLKIIINLINE